MLKNRFRSLTRRRESAGCEVALNPGCARLEVNNWEVSDFVATRLVPIVGVHPFPLNELCLMVAAVAALKPSHIFEWGTNIGKSARIFHEASLRFGVPCAVYSVDLPDEADHAEHPRSKRGMLVKGKKGVTLLTGDGLETSLALCRQLRGEGRFRPLFFLDGDHGYQSVRRELQGIVAEIPEADILLHDTFFQSEESGYNVGPHRALREVVAATDRYLVISEELGLPGMTLLYRKQGIE